MRRILLSIFIFTAVIGACSKAQVRPESSAPVSEAEPTPVPDKFTPVKLPDLPETDPCLRGWVCVDRARLGKYSALWAVSDIHGNFEKFSQLLDRAGLAERRENEWYWKEGVTGQLLVINGDMLNKGPHSVDVARLAFRLRDDGVKTGNLVLILLGNHEVEILAGDKGHMTPELGLSANQNSNRMWLRYETFIPRIITRKEVRRESRLARELRRLPVGAMVGDWIFTHSGYIDLPAPELAKDHAEKVRGFLQQEGERVSEAAALCESAASEEEWDACESLYKSLLEGKSFLDSHNWWKKKLTPMRKHLSAIGIKTLFFGHDPEALKARGEVAATADGRFVKLDTGMGNDQKIQGARMLKCQLAGGPEENTKPVSKICSQFDIESGEVPLKLSAN